MSEVVDEREITCIGCPKGCQITVKKLKNGEIEPEGYSCKKGKEYAIQEYTDPRRILTTTMKVKGGKLPLIPVRSNKGIPKGKLIDGMDVIANKQADAPIKMGDVLISNILGLDVDILASRDLD
ncbi:MAG: DUF1667 domain-containing protein [Promethearchaeota archaeon]|nr:MAG: DUF1667 domain-containing protein [Candidatus Lokiarchaeota archaeon]